LELNILSHLQSNFRRGNGEYNVIFPLVFLNKQLKGLLSCHYSKHGHQKCGRGEFYVFSREKSGVKSVYTSLTEGHKGITVLNL
jgi:hypothetical protein